MPTPSTTPAASQFQKSLKAISLATWNRTRSSNELQSFIERRQRVIEAMDHS